MDALKEGIFNYLLGFIKEREREVRTSDLFDELMRKFSSKLKDKCGDVVFSDEMFVESTIHETHIVYGLTYTTNGGKSIGLTDEGNKAAEHLKGILGYLSDKEKEKKSVKLQNSLQAYTGTVSAVVAVVSFCVSLNLPNTMWLNNIGYLACGLAIGLGATFMFRFLADKIGKKKES